MWEDPEQELVETSLPLSRGSRDSSVTPVSKQRRPTTAELSSPSSSPPLTRKETLVPPIKTNNNNNNNNVKFKTITGKTSSNRNTVQENILNFLESKKYGAIYLENSKEENEDDFLKSLENNDISSSASFEIKDKDKLLDPYALTAKFTNDSGLPQVVFDDVDYYVPSTLGDDMTISEMSSTIGSTTSKKSFLKANGPKFGGRGGIGGGSTAGSTFKSKKSNKSENEIATQMKLINSKATTTGINNNNNNDASKEEKEAKSFYNLGLLYCSPEERKYKKSEEYLCRALNARLKVNGKQSYLTAEVYEKLGDVLVLLEDSNTARTYYSEAIQGISSILTDVDDEHYDDAISLDQRVRKSLASMPLTSARDPNEHSMIWESVN